MVGGLCGRRLRSGRWAAYRATRPTLHRMEGRSTPKPPSSNGGCRAGGNRRVSLRSHHPPGQWHVQSAQAKGGRLLPPPRPKKEGWMAVLHPEPASSIPYSTTIRLVACKYKGAAPTKAAPRGRGNGSPSVWERLLTRGGRSPLRLELFRDL